jgi:uncharacterized membrane-anchored protein YhcB (DUF1043 family)
MDLIIGIIIGLIIGIIAAIFYEKSKLKKNSIKIVTFKTELGIVIGKLDQYHGDLIYFYTIYDSVGMYKETERNCINKRFLYKEFILFQ